MAPEDFYNARIPAGTLLKISLHNSSANQVQSANRETKVTDCDEMMLTALHAFREIEWKRDDPVIDVARYHF